MIPQKGLVLDANILLRAAFGRRARIDELRRIEFPPDSLFDLFRPLSSRILALQQLKAG